MALTHAFWRHFHEGPVPAFLGGPVGSGTPMQRTGGVYPERRMAEDECVRHTTERLIGAICHFSASNDLPVGCASCQRVVRGADLGWGGIAVAIRSRLLLSAALIAGAPLLLEQRQVHLLDLDSPVTFGCSDVSTNYVVPTSVTSVDLSVGGANGGSSTSPRAEPVDRRTAQSP